ncbi:MAG: hypothetical protein ACRCW2_00525 [Cellulosilyticaceae bacterium]
MKNQSAFRKCLNQAIEAIERLAFDDARGLIFEAMGLDAGAPEPHNLLGILAEYEADRGLAARHYRAAMAMDPTYLPAENNLARVTSTNGFVMKPRDFGRDDLREEGKYYVEFDSHNIGHVKKKNK